MYPVNPVKAETYGNTESIIGDYFAATGKRDQWVLATKHSGEGSHVRDGAPISGQSIRPVLEGNLKRLKNGCYRPLSIALAQSRQLYVSQELAL